MRYKLLIASVLLLCGTMLLLSVTGRITLYIHPRYVGFSVVMTIIATILLIASWPDDHKPAGAGYTHLAVAAVALLAAALPAQTLSARVAGNRAATPPSLQQTVQISSFDAFSKDFSRFSLQDWAVLLADPSNHEIVENKEASVSGFLFRDEQNRPFIARFKMSCCAVDATPITIPLTGNLADGMSVNHWYAVRGDFKPAADQQPAYALHLTAAEPIEEPGDPYVY